MSDAIDDFRAIKNMRTLLRAKYGVECPRCRAHRPNAHASILLPQQECRIDGYKDARLELTQADYDTASEDEGQP